MSFSVSRFSISFTPSMSFLSLARILPIVQIVFCMVRPAEVLSVPNKYVIFRSKPLSYLLYIAYSIPKISYALGHFNWSGNGWNIYTLRTLLCAAYSISCSYMFVIKSRYILDWLITCNIKLSSILSREYCADSCTAPHAQLRIIRSKYEATSSPSILSVFASK